jgi:hypothetical protein
VLTGYKLPFKTTDFRLVECPLSVRPDILPGPMSANHPKAAVRGKWARMSAYDPKQTLDQPSLDLIQFTYIPELTQFLTHSMLCG